jgi:Domain of unknown function (DUF4340)
MQFRGLLAAAALLAILGAGVFWSNKSKEAEKGKPVEGASPNVLTIQEADIAQLEFRKRGMDSVIVKREGDTQKWKLTSPKQLQADADAVSSVTNALSVYTSESVDDKPGELFNFGLKDPLFSLVITKKSGKTVTLSLGDDVPVGGSMFVKVDSDPRVFAVSSSSRATLDKTWKDLRDKRLLPIEGEKLSRVEISSNGKAVEFGKNQSNEWQVVKPNPYRADNWAVEELVRKLKEAKLDPNAPAAELDSAAKAFAGSAPVAVAKMTDANGTQTLEIRKSQTGKEPVYYAKSSSVDGVHKVNADLATAAAKPADDYRNKKLFDFGFSDPSKLDIKVNGVSKSCGKNGEKWVCNNKEVQPQSVSSFVDKIRDLSAKKFVEKPGNISGSGYIEISVTTSDAKKTETVRIAGNAGARGDEPAMYELDPASVQGLKTAFDAIKEPAPTGKK